MAIIYNYIVEVLFYEEFMVLFRKYFVFLKIKKQTKFICANITWDVTFIEHIILNLSLSFAKLFGHAPSNKKA